jgi:hypothetical protein
MIRTLISALWDVGDTLASHRKKYGGATKAELVGIGNGLANELSKLLSDVEPPSVMRLFVDAEQIMRAKAVPRFGIIVVGSAMYKSLRQLRFNHRSAQSLVDKWDLHMDDIV